MSVRKYVCVYIRVGYLSLEYYVESLIFQNRGTFYSTVYLHWDAYNFMC